ncbi:zonular occludens toxin domain-containing protein [Paracidovorax konjaci]|uniref:Zona occludens toxin n=1 Tax=Paracidovorax konjaci TaxID=32040 RepID=A0A1I1VVQ3_9BURK|nr:zonular occludens toxin domain-containing protein [Paracidovorax konjaci]SFD87176.1 zona occludens toxin [Paracidovorax konjaci]
MITIITGVPGAGKTLYAIEKLLLPLVGKTINVPDGNGGEKELPRTIYTNINGLLIEHEIVDTGGDWLKAGGDFNFDGNELSARNWHKWAKPGSVIVIDEFQKMWPPRPNGASIPPDVQALDTHRHMGVDFILITQSVMNTDRHVHALGGRHLHVRRVANMGLAVVYEWDHVSRSLMYSKAITKSPWKYSRKVQKLYRSAEVHTKQPRKLPGLVWFILAAIGAGIYFGPSVVQRLGARMNGSVGAPDAKQNAPASAPAHAPAASASANAATQAPPDERVDFLPRLSDRPWTAPAYDQLRKVVAMPLITGAMCINDACKCYAGGSRLLDVSSDACRQWAIDRPFNAYVAQQSAEAGQSDAKQPGHAADSPS